MKKLIIIATMLVLAGCINMPTRVPAKESSIENVIDVPGYNKAQIYAATKIWIAESFHSAKAVIQDEDKDAGRIIGHANVAYVCSLDASTCEAIASAGYRFNFIMRLDMKDGKVKMTLTQMMVSGPQFSGYPLSQDEFEGNARGTVTRLSKELQAAINKEKTNSNW